MIKINYYGDLFFYRGYYINTSKAYKNKISVFNSNWEFCGDYPYIISAKRDINNGLKSLIALKLWG